MIEQLRIAIPVLWPAMTIAGAMMLVAWWPHCDKSGTPLAQRERGWAGALALGLAFVAAFLRLVVREQVPFLPLRERWQWLPKPRRTNMPDSRRRNCCSAESQPTSILMTVAIPIPPYCASGRWRPRMPRAQLMA